MKRFVNHPATLLTVALLVQVAIAFLGANSSQHPMGDVVYAYEPWMDAMISGGKWFGINTAWVYPYPALVPLFLVQAITPNAFLVGWLILAIALNQAALWYLLRKVPAAQRLVWFWIVATIALGPVALSRLDGLSVSLAIFGVANLLSGHVTKSAVWLTLASWLKVWPVAILTALMLPLDNRLKVLRAVLYSSLALVIVGYLLGGNQSLFSFILAQGNRGIQIESIVAMPWVWADVQHQGAHIYFDTNILTFQVRGAGALKIARSMGWFMLGAVLLTFALALVAKIRKAKTSDLVSFTALALTLDLILFNKVGSPQYLGWLIVPVMIGLSYRVRGWWLGIFGVLLATVGTQIIYPNVYDDLLNAQLLPVILLTVRNAIEVAIFAWTIWRLARLAFKKQTQETSHDLILD